MTKPQPVAMRTAFGEALLELGPHDIYPNPPYLYV